MGILLSPAEIVHHILYCGKGHEPVVERCGSSRVHGEGHRSLCGQDGKQLSLLPAEGVVLQVEQQRYLVALRVAIYHAEAAVHQVPGSRGHGVAEGDVERLLQVPLLLGQSCESVAVKASYDVYPFEHRPVKRLLEAAHLSVKCVKVHSKGNIIDCKIKKKT